MKFILNFYKLKKYKLRKYKHSFLIKEIVVSEPNNEQCQ